ncbi:MAG: hypothetical protein RLZZ502_727 [Pseudomonadota bacterium]|jgi:predicted nuclease of predicted toxin-antitoxin system
MSKVLHFLIDAQLPPSLKRIFKKHNVRATHVFEVMHHFASDKFIARYANELGAIIVSKDADFAQQIQHNATHPKVLWIRLPNSKFAQLSAAIDLALPGLIAQFQAGARLIELKEPPQ